MDITDAAQVSEVITKVSPDVVIHCAHGQPLTLLKMMIRKPRLRLSMQMVLKILPMSANA